MRRPDIRRRGATTGVSALETKLRSTQLDSWRISPVGQVLFSIAETYQQASDIQGLSYKGAVNYKDRIFVYILHLEDRFLQQ
jgi:hypothetical protein